MNLNKIKSFEMGCIECPYCGCRSNRIKGENIAASGEPIYLSVEVIRCPSCFNEFQVSSEELKERMDQVLSLMKGMKDNNNKFRGDDFFGS